MHLLLIKYYYTLLVGWGWTPEDASQTEGFDESVDEIEDVAEPLDESVDKETDFSAS